MVSDKLRLTKVSGAKNSQYQVIHEILYSKYNRPTLTDIVGSSESAFLYGECVLPSSVRCSV